MAPLFVGTRGRRIGHRVRLVIAAGWAAGLLGVAGSAWGQWGGDRFGDRERFSPRFSTGDLGVIDRTFDLDENQETIVRLLLNDYRTAFDAGASETREAMEAARAALRETARTRSRDDWRERIEEVRAPLNEWETASESLERKFLADLKNVLRPGQMERWPSWERRLYREEQLPRGMLSGESVDVLGLVSSLEIEPTPQVAAVLDAYELQLDAALKARERDLEQAMEDLREAFQSQDFDRAIEAIDRQAKLRTRVRDLNESTVRQLESLLAADAASRLRESFMTTAFAEVYRPTRATRAFDAVLALETLDDAQRTTIEALRRTYDSQLERANAKLVDAIRKTEPTEMQERIERMRERLVARLAQNDGEGGDRGRPRRGDWDDDEDEGPVDVARDERRELDERTILQLEAVLTPAQREVLPEEDEGRGDRRGPRRGWDD